MTQGIAYQAGLRYLDGQLPGTPNRRLLRCRGKFYKWSGSHYQVQTDESVRNDVTRWLARNEGVRRIGDQPQPLTTSFVQNVMMAITAETAARGDVEPGTWIDNRPMHTVGPFLSTAGGILDLGGLNRGKPVLLKPTADFFSLTSLPHDPDATTPSPLFHRFLTDTFGDERQVIQLIQEIFGYCLWPDCRFEAVFIWFGEANTGKSTLAETLTSMLGSSNVSGIPLDRLGERFALPALQGKLANIVLDTGEIDKTAEGLLKALISGEPVPFEEKHQPLATMRLMPKHIFVTNILPRFHDTSNGTWRRLQIVRFDRVHPEGDRDLDLKTRLQGELPGITEWALQGLARLLLQARFTEVPRSRDILRRYREESNPVSLFLTGECVRDLNGRVARKLLYQVYKEWAADNGHSALSSTRFHREVAAIQPQPDEPPRDGRGGDRMFVGIRLVHEADAFRRLQVLDPGAAEAG